MAQKSYSAIRLDLYDVIAHLRIRGQSFTRIAREVPIWKERDPARHPLSGSELQRWHDRETIRRCCPSPSRANPRPYGRGASGGK
jgi:hypothetical protein